MLGFIITKSMHPNTSSQNATLVKTAALKSGTGFGNHILILRIRFKNRIVILPIWLNHRGETPPWFNEHASSHKLFLDSLHCADTFPREFGNITDGIALVQEVYDLSIFFPLFILGLDGTCRSAEFTAFFNILLST